MKKLICIAIAIFTAATSFAQIEVGTNGNVGIGTTPSSGSYYKLITSNALFDNAKSPNIWCDVLHGKSNPGITVSGNLNINGLAWVSGVPVTSDRRFKKNIVSLNGSTMLDKIKLIDGTMYDYKTNNELLAMYESGELKFRVDTSQIEEVDKNGKKQIVKKEKILTPKFKAGKSYGFIAQDVMEVFPEFVLQDSTNGNYAINYIEFIPVLLEAVKEQQVQIENLEAEVKSLTNNGHNKEKKASATESINVTENALYQNAPNPFSKTTVIEYFLAETTKTASIMVYDMTGKQLKSIALTTFGNGSINISANELEAGMYMYALIADGQIVDSKRMIITE